MEIILTLSFHLYKTRTIKGYSKTKKISRTVLSIENMVLTQTMIKLQRTTPLTTGSPKRTSRPEIRI